MPIVTIPRDGHLGVTVQVVSAGEGPFDQNILEVHDLAGPPKGVRLMGLTYAFGSGVEATLWWEDASGAHDLLLPLEARGAMDFTALGGLINPQRPGSTGHIRLITKHKEKGETSFFLALVLTKLTA